jgi:hypothetical protein
MVARRATLVLLLSALLVGWSISSPALEGLVVPVVIIGSLVAGLLYGRAWGWKGLLMSIVIALVYAVAGFIGVIFYLRSLPPGAGFGGFVAGGIAGVGVVIIGGISLFLALISGVVGAVLHRRHKR